MYTSRRNRITTPFIPNSRLMFTLPLGGKIMKAWIVLTGTIVVAGGTTSGTAVGEGGPTRLIQRIKMIATPLGGSRYPGGNVVDAAPRSLVRYAIVQRNGKFFTEQAGSTLGGGAAATYAIYLAIPLYFADATLRETAIAALNTDNAAQGTPGGTYASVQVEVDTGDLTSCFVGNDRVVTWNGLQCQYVDHRANIVGDTMVRYQEDHVFLIAAAQDRALDQAMPQTGAFESWTIMEEQGANLTLASTLLTRVQCKSPVHDYDLWKNDLLQQMLDDDYIDPSTNAAGFSHIDWTDGIAQNMIPAGQLETWLSVLNPSGANADQLRIFTRRLVAPNPAS